MMFGEVQMAFWVGYKQILSNRFIISKQNHRPDVKTFHHWLYGGKFHAYKMCKTKFLHHKKALSQYLAK